MSDVGFSPGVYRDTWATKIDSTLSTEGRDRIVTEATLHEMLTLGSFFRCHDKDFVSPEIKHFNNYVF
jgi:hypothetical protein